MVRWSVALSSFPSLLLFYSAWNPTVWLQLCVLECVCSPRRQDDKKAVSLFVTWVGLFCTLALTCSIQQTLTVCICMRVCLRPGAGREREWWWAAHTWSCEVVRGAGKGKGDAWRCVTCIYEYRHFSVQEESGGRPHISGCSAVTSCGASACIISS